MEETLKKLVYAGVGFAAQATEKFEAAVDDLVKKGKLSDKEGKKIVDDFFSKSEKKKADFESKFKTMTTEIVEKFNFAKSKDVEALAKKVAKLEKELKKSAPKKVTTRKAAPKKAAPAKTTTAATVA